MKRWAIIFGIIVVALGAGGWWFWSLASVKIEAAPQVTLKIDRPPVSVRRAGATVFEEATNGMALAAGWVVKTGDGGQATLTFFRQAESRLDQNSEVVISDAALDPDDATKLTVGLKLEIGRLWSRILRLFDLDSRFSVKTSSVVATVRGTAFAVSANANGSSGVLVSESAVSVTPAGRAVLASATSGAAVAEGFEADYDAAGKFVKRAEISREERAGRWFMTNTLSDMAFVRAEREARRAELRALGGARPDSPLDGFTQLSERLHLSLTDEKARDRLTESYAARRLGHLIELAETGKAGLASQEFARLENVVRTKLRGPESAGERKRLKVALARAALLVEDAAPSSSLYPFKQRLEDLAAALAEEDRAAQLFSRLLITDARLDEASRLLDENALEETSTALEAAKSGVENVERDLAAAAPSVAGAPRETLRDKIFAVKVRADALSGRLQIALRQTPPETPAATSTEMLAPTSTAPVIPFPKPAPTSTTSQPPVPSPIPTPTPTPTPTPSPQYSGITAYIQPNPINVGQTAKLTVMAARLIGGQDDVTTRTKFSLARGQGSLNGPVFTGTVAGTVIIQADYSDNGAVHSSQATLMVSGLATLTGLMVTASPAELASNQTASLTVMAKYSNGYTKNVTTLAKLQNLSPSLGTLSGTLFTAAAKGSGMAEIQATYTEDGTGQTGTVFIPVTETQPAYNPTTGY